jgi:hypothetical protein
MEVLQSDKENSKEVEDSESFICELNAMKPDEAPSWTELGFPVEIPKAFTASSIVWTGLVLREWHVSGRIEPSKR